MKSFIVDYYNENEPDAFEIIWADDKESAWREALDMGLEVLEVKELEE